MGANLFLPLTEEETQTILRVVKNQAYWLDLTLDRKTNEFKTRNGIQPTYTNWAQGEPNLRNHEFCVHFRVKRDGTWNDIPCTKTFHYICQIRCSIPM